MLHFAEIYWRPSSGYQRRFDVVAEGQIVLDDYPLGVKGFATADRKSFELVVRDGRLDIEFIRGRLDPKISAIEIRAVRRR